MESELNRIGAVKIKDSKNSRARSRRDRKGTGSLHRILGTPNNSDIKINEILM